MLPPPRNDPIIGSDLFTARTTAVAVMAMLSQTRTECSTSRDAYV